MSCGAGNFAEGLCRFCCPTHLGSLDARFCREYGRYPCRQPGSRGRGKRARRIRGGTAALRRLTILSSPVLDERVGTKVFLKAEMLQRTGSFKFRGAFNRLSAIPQDSHGGGVVAY